MSFISIFISAILYGIEPSIVTLALNKGANAKIIVLACSLLCVFFSFVASLILKEKIIISFKQILLSILCGILFYIVNYLLELAYEIIPVGLATTLHFTYPIIVYILSIILFHESITYKRIISILLCLFGLVLISGFNANANLSGVIITLITAIAYSIYLLIIDKSSLNTLSTFVLSFYVSIGSSLAGIITLGGVDMGNIQDIYIHKEYIIASALMLFLASILVNVGIRKVGASIASILMVIEPISSLITSTLIFKYEISISSIIGCIFVLLSILLVVVDNNN